MATKSETPLRRTIGRFTFDDAFAWLEPDSEAALAWQITQAATADERLASDDFAGLRDAIAPHVRAAFAFAPQHRGPYWFHGAIGAQGYVVSVSRSATDPGELLIDVSPFAPAGVASLDFYYPSPNGRYVAFGVSLNGDEQSVLRIVDTATKHAHAIAIPFASNCAVSWLPDETGFYYSAGLKSDFEDVTKHLFFHRIGDAVQREPEPVAVREQYSLKPQVSADGRYVAALTSEIFPRPDFIKSLPDGVWRPFLADAPGQIIGVFAEDAYIAIITHDAPRGRLVSIPLASAHDQSTWRELLPQTDRVMRTLERVGDHLVLCEFEDSFARLRVLRIDGGVSHEVKLPGDGVVRQNGLAIHYQLIGYGGDNIYPGNEDFSFVFSTFTEAPSTHRYDLKTRALEELAQSPLRLEGVRVQRRCAAASTGAAKYFLIAREDADLTTPRPTLVYGYGGFNVCFIPGYLGALAPFVSSGGVIAFAQARGGAEFGLNQWLDGRLERKQHTFDDVCAVGDDLIACGVTSPELLGLTGSSGGGMMAGAVLTQRPDLWRVVCAMVPLFDIMLLDRDPYTALVALDLGDPRDPEASEWLSRWSPYHNVRPADFPATLIITAAHDMRCRPWHARKFAAALQAANTGPHPILLKVLDEGHFGGFLNADRAAVWLGFVMRELGLAAPGCSG